MSPTPWLAELQQLLAGRVSVLPEDLIAASADSSPIAGECSAVVRVRTEADVVELLRWADARRVPVVPRAAATSATGAARPTQGSVVLDLRALHRILDIDTRDMVAVVEPGVITAQLQSAVEAQNLFYPPDPASADECTIGGNIATCAGGLRAVKYGVTRDYVLGLRCVLPGGAILETGGRNLKDVSGYDLTRLLTGSEGTLAVITQAILRLIPRPQSHGTLLLSFAGESAAFDAADAILLAGIWPRALESLDEVAMRLTAEGSGIPLPVGARSQLLVELDGEPLAVRDSVERVQKMFERSALAVRDVSTGAEHEAIWRGRRGISRAARRMSPLKHSEDIGVPRGHLAEVVGQLKALGKAHGIGMLIYGHAGDANLHCNFLPDPQRADAGESLAACVRAAFDLVLSHGGTLTGEHGVGLRKRDELPRVLGPERMRVLYAIKNAFDPHGILNPGKVLRETHP
jgi:glycolate oxidase subunit GlcD